MVLVQSPAEAAYKEMPRSAIEFDGPIGKVAPLRELAHDVTRLVLGGARAVEQPPVAAAPSDSSP